MKSLIAGMLAIVTVPLVATEAIAQASASDQTTPSSKAAVVKPKRLKTSPTVASARNLILTLQSYSEELEKPSEETFQKLQKRISKVVAQLKDEGRQTDAQRLALWNKSVAGKLYSESSQSYRTAQADLALANRKPGPLPIGPATPGQSPDGKSAQQPSAQLTARQNALRERQRRINLQNQQRAKKIMQMMKGR